MIEELIAYRDYSKLYGFILVNFGAYIFKGFIWCSKNKEEKQKGLLMYTRYEVKVDEEWKGLFTGIWGLFNHLGIYPECYTSFNDFFCEELINPSFFIQGKKNRDLLERSLFYFTESGAKYFEKVIEKFLLEFMDYELQDFRVITIEEKGHNLSYRDNLQVAIVTY